MIDCNEMRTEGKSERGTDKRDTRSGKKLKAGYPSVRNSLKTKKDEKKTGGVC